ncbi:MAG: septum formation protein Maf [Bacteroidales bacterium]|nr:septum formation protein Maf [Bacteroidales bacterium]
MNPLNQELQKYHLILASRSPRRQHLLKELGLDFEIMPVNTDESYPEGLSAEEIAVHLCEKKADAVLPLIEKPGYLLITADTIVCHKNRVLSKPVDTEDARYILSELSGSMHEVITGVCLSSHEKRLIFHEITKVYFNGLTRAQIIFYVDKYKPFDKAGAYGIQEWIGLAGVRRIEGCFFNVMGLPVPRFYNELMAFVQNVSI